jgi:parallel beta-helix repeat protein
MQNAALSGLEVSQNSARECVRPLRCHADRRQSPTAERRREQRGYGIIIGNTISGNRRHGLTVQQASHADVAANTFNGNGEVAIRVFGNSGVNLADSAMRVFQQPNTTTTPNGGLGIRCEVGAYIEGPLGTLNRIRVASIDATP